MSAQFPQLLLDTQEKIAIDAFAGGGGASLGYKMATGRDIDVAINHDAKALSMHEANHRQTLHLKSDIFEVNPLLVCQGKQVGFMWASPDCTYHSKARGSKPIRHANQRRRGLAWVVSRWANQVEPDVIALENVEEFADWGPLHAKRCKNTRRIIRNDGTVAQVGERTEIEYQELIPNKRKKRRSFRKWVNSLRDRQGNRYVVEWKELRACDYGAPTIRKRFYLIARCDNRPIVWPTASHSGAHAEIETLTWERVSALDKLKVATLEVDRLKLRRKLESIDKKIAKLRDELKANPRLKKYKTAADCIDWDIPMLSIFATKDEAKAFSKQYGVGVPQRPLEDTSLTRIARGIHRFVIDCPKPFTRPIPGWAKIAGLTVDVAHGEVDSKGKKRWGNSSRSVESPSPTVTASGNPAVVAGFLTEHANASSQRVFAPWEPLRTQCADVKGGHFSLVAPLMAQLNFGDTPFSSYFAPMRTVVSGGGHHSLIAGFLSIFRTGAIGTALWNPTPTITANSHDASKSHPGGSVPIGLVAASFAPFFVPRYGERSGQAPRTRSVQQPSPSVVPDGNGASLVVANLATYYGAKSAKDGRGSTLWHPLPTQPTENRFAIIASFLAQNNGGFAIGNTGDGKSMSVPMTTSTNKGANQSLVAAFLERHNNGFDNRVGRRLTEPSGSVCADGTRQSLIACFTNHDYGRSTGRSMFDPQATVTSGGGGHAGLVAAFLDKYYGTGGGQSVDDPAGTVTTKDRLGLVTVTIEGQPMVMTDICMRMLQPRELYRAQGFPDDYIIDRGADGTPLTKTEQVRMCGNSVCPPVAEAIIAANVPDMIVRGNHLKEKLAVAA